MAQTNNLAENPHQPPPDLDFERIVVFFLDAADELEHLAVAL